MRDIQFLRIQYLQGPNLWTYRAVLEAWVDIGELEDAPSNTIPGFVDRLLAWLPSLQSHHCSIGAPGGFVQRLRDGTWPAHILEHVTIELQNLAGMQTGFGKAREAGVRGIYKLVVRSRNERVSRAALAAARELVLAAMDDRPHDVAATVARLREMVDALCLGPSTACIVDAATERGIPHLRLTEGNLVQLGYGARQRRIWTAETDSTSAIAESISSDKDLTKRLLQSCGVPVPEGRVVRDPADAWDAAEDIGGPVVVKPSDANHGRGVSIELRRREDVEAAFAVADAEGSEVIVERFIPGLEHRLLVVGNRLVAATRGDMASVTGDGHSSIAELVARQINSDPRRGEDEVFPLDIVRLDDPAVRLELERQGCTRDTVPAAGQVVRVLRNGNLAIDVTDQVHPEVAAAATLAARVVGLDIAGVDLVAQDISRPLEAQGGAIVEVNAGPGLLMHLKPAEGQARPVGRAIVDHLFAPQESGRIPVVGVAGRHGTTLISQLVAWLLQLSGRHVGLACAEGLYLDRRQVDRRPAHNARAGRRLLINRMVDAAVFENGAETILDEGLAYDRCAVGIVTDVSGVDAMARWYIREPEQLWNVLRTQVDVVLDDGAAVLNADDPLVARMAALCDGEVIFYGLEAGLPAIAEHRAQGGRAVFLQGQKVVMASGADETVLVSLDSLPLLQHGEVELRCEAVLAAVAAGWALGIDAPLLRTGIETCEPQVLSSSPLKAAQAG